MFLAYLDDWQHLYSVPSAGGTPLLLTPGAFMVEHVVSEPRPTHPHLRREYRHHGRVMMTAGMCSECTSIVQIPLAVTSR